MVVDSSSVLASDSSDCAPVGPFVQRPFPPPALENVPLPYILDQLHNLAIHYWDKPETADCTIIVPILPTPRARPTRNSTPCSLNMPLTPPPDTPALPIRTNNPAGLGRRVTEPTPPVTRVTRMTSKLHLDYLLAQSFLFRALFSGRSLLEHMKPTCPNSPTTPPPSGPHAAASQNHTIPPSRLPRVLPSSSTHPIVYLPLPHPQSFPHLVHYMYFGTTSVLEDALSRRQLRWDDVVRNVEYLGMRTRIKVFLGRWYARWLAPSHAHVECRPPVVHEDAEDGYECASDDDMDFDDDEYDSSSSDSESGSGSDSDMDTDTDIDSDYDPTSDAFLDPSRAASGLSSSLPTTRLAMLRKKSLSVSTLKAKKSVIHIKPSVSTLKAKKSAIAIKPKQEEESSDVLPDDNDGDDEQEEEGDVENSDNEDDSNPPRGRTKNRSRPNAPEHSPKRRRRPA